MKASSKEALKIILIITGICFVLLAILVSFIFRSQIEDYFNSKKRIEPLPSQYADYPLMGETLDSLSFQIKYLNGGIDDVPLMKDENDNVYLVTYEQVDNKYSLSVINAEGNILSQREINYNTFGNRYYRTSMSIFETKEYIITTIKNSDEANFPIEKHLVVSDYRGIVKPIEEKEEVRSDKFKAYYDRATVVIYGAEKKYEYNPDPDADTNITVHFAQMIIDGLPYVIYIYKHEDIELFTARFEEKGNGKQVELSVDFEFEQRSRFAPDFMLLGETIDEIELQFFQRESYYSRPIFYYFGNPPSSHWNGMAYCKLKLSDNKSYYFKYPIFEYQNSRHELPLVAYKGKTNFFILFDRGSEATYHMNSSYIIRFTD